MLTQKAAAIALAAVEKKPITGLEQYPAENSVPRLRS